MIHFFQFVLSNIEEFYPEQNISGRISVYLNIKVNQNMLFNVSPKILNNRTFKEVMFNVIYKFIIVYALIIFFYFHFA